jgi:hypothetical protein
VGFEPTVANGDTRSPGAPDSPLQHLSDAWRRGWDSNPRGLSPTAFRERHHKPLGHLSRPVTLYNYFLWRQSGLHKNIYGHCPCIQVREVAWSCILQEKVLCDIISFRNLPIEHYLQRNGRAFYKKKYFMVLFHSAICRLSIIYIKERVHQKLEALR